MLEEVESKECKEFIGLQTVRQAAALNYLSGKQAFDHHWKQLNTLSNHWLEISFPWLSGNKEMDNTALMGRWKRAHKVKDLNEPEIKTKIEAAANANLPSGARHEGPSVSGNWVKGTK